MRICVTSFGSLGDVLPYIAVGQRLQQRGHEIVFATLDRFAGQVTEAGLRFVSLGVAWDDAAFDAMMAEVVATKNPIRQGRIIFERTHHAVLSAVPRLTDVVSDCDVVFTHVYHLAGYAAAVRAQRPFASGHLITSMIPSLAPGPTQRDLGPLGNRARRWLLDTVIARLTDPAVNRLLRESGCAAKRHAMRRGLHSQRLNLVAVSQTLRPRDSSWPPHYALTGAWRLAFQNDVSAHETALPEPLQRFLASGSAPVFATLGSTTGMDARRLRDALVDGAKRAGARVIVQAGWAGLDVVPSANVFLLPGFVPYQALLPHVRGVIHHGGAGTSAECFHAGIPSAVVWSIADQRAWATLAVRLGVCSGALHHSQLDAAWVAERITALDLHRAAASALAVKLNAEPDGASEAARLLEEEFTPGRRHHRE